MVIHFGSMHFQPYQQATENRRKASKMYPFKFGLSFPLLSVAGAFIRPSPRHALEAWKSTRLEDV
ncbi:hypothetical protein BD309DRAFT_992208 [Dichomitus squalens]|uniref:Uncharacterized protein n=1 Tax=Dichomitus squalens TaxID=114155 RepID=A0A4Q9NK60_9APHY|nr:hypothetical protein BD309DRAFT_992208 [Dichomitus squalens]TBU59444.1 hypothetical protein BD310DRAFT_976635 [Dichomitus squalens]